MNTQTAPQVTTWKLDPAHSVAEFKVRHMMVSYVKGEFSGLTGSLSLDEAEPLHSRVEATIDAASLNTREPQRDAHLRSADFFDVEKFPTLSFVSHRVTLRDDGLLEVTGDLTIHGVTRETVFTAEGPSDPVRDPWGNTRIGVSAKTKIDRKDFGLRWNGALETGGVLVGDDVTIALEVEFLQD